ncbi:MAG TPA: hypothetical protein PLN81_12650, partial [Bacillota bacterium]|nr:hypothetical protein [Bacillota bacterium]
RPRNIIYDLNINSQVFLGVLFQQRSSSVYRLGTYSLKAGLEFFGFLASSAGQGLVEPIFRPYFSRYGWYAVICYAV